MVIGTELRPRVSKHHNPYRALRPAIVRIFGRGKQLSGLLRLEIIQMGELIFFFPNFWFLPDVQNSEHNPRWY